MNAKDLGELNEIRFLYEATSRGFVVSSPYGDNQPYDFIVDSNSRLYKFQIKSFTRAHPKTGSYAIKVCKGSNRQKYKIENVDYVAIYLGDRRDWYIIPFSEIKGTGVYIANTNQKYELYKNNWNLDV